MSMVHLNQSIYFCFCVNAGEGVGWMVPILHTKHQYYPVTVYLHTMYDIVLCVRLAWHTSTSTHLQITHKNDNTNGMSFHNSIINIWHLFRCDVIEYHFVTFFFFSLSLALNGSSVSYYMSFSLRFLPRSSVCLLLIFFHVVFPRVHLSWHGCRSDDIYLFYQMCINVVEPPSLPPTIVTYQTNIIYGSVNI